MGHRTIRGQPQYFVLFVGYVANIEKDGENIWLAKEKLSNAKELLAEYRSVHGL